VANTRIHGYYDAMPKLFLDRAVAYIRVSTDRQELGPEVQRHAIEQWALKEGVTIVAWHVEVVSGGAAIDQRPILLLAISELETWHAKRLVVHKLDRFSRDPFTAAIAENSIRRLGGELACVEGAGAGDDPTSQLIRGVLLTVAKFERAMISARTKAALQAKVRRGEALGKAVYGTRKVGKLFEGDQREQDIIERARLLRACGTPIRKVREILALEGMVNRNGKPFGVAELWFMTCD
jgi:site-specific DNA recombinase